MRVIKLGGTTVTKVDFVRELTERMKDSTESIIIVLSALSKVTNLLEHLNVETNKIYQKKIIKEISLIHTEYINQLFIDKKYLEIAIRLNRRIMFQLESAIKQDKKNNILIFGEYLSTSIYSLYLKMNNIEHFLKNSTQFIRLDKNGEPDLKNIRHNCKNTACGNINIFQGFICSDSNGDITSLSRGGSDFTASLLAEAVNADIIEIWTDIDGLRSNDPRFVNNTSCVTHLNYTEAAELAYFGAKILHPESVLPAQRANIPIVLKNSKNTNHNGTVINNKENEHIIKAIASKDDVVLINITSYRMLMAYGFLSKIFDVFGKYKTAIDLITTSEISVSLSIDDTTFLKEIFNELHQFSDVKIKKHMSIISVIGNFGKKRKAIASQALNLISNPIEIMSYGTNRRNISVLVEQKYKIKNLNELNKLITNIN